MKTNNWMIKSLLILMSVVMLAACGAQPTPDLAQLSTQIASGIYAELTAVALANPTATPAPTETPVPSTPTTAVTEVVPTATIAVVPPPATNTTGDNSKFVSDVTIPDGTVVNPGDIFDKTWSFENTGTTTWTRNYTIRYISGNLLGSNGTTSDNLTIDVKPGKTGDATIKFTAPTDAGTFTSTWMLYNPEGSPFGEYVTISIVVR